MRAFVSIALAGAFFARVVLAPVAAAAAEPVPSSGTAAPVAPPAASAAPVAPAPRTQARGLAVLAVGDGVFVAWPLARALYGKAGLRPVEIDEAHARVLAGEPPVTGAAKDLTDLAETRAAIRGDDAPSRQLLASIATQFHVRGIVVVMPAVDLPTQARVFVADSASFDAARYAPDEGKVGDTAEADWSGAVASLDRAYGISLAPAPTPVAGPAPSLATHALAENKEKDATSRPFYASPWFWGAVGAAALGATALYFATRDNAPSQIHLQLQVPK